MSRLALLSWEMRLRTLARVSISCTELLYLFESQADIEFSEHENSAVGHHTYPAAGEDA